MRTRLSIFLAVILLAPFVTQGQTGTLRGVVLNSETRTPLENANILLTQDQRGTATDRRGSFALDQLPAGTFDLVVSHVGFKPFRSTVVIAEGEASELTVRLEPVILPGQTVVVDAVQARERITPIAFGDIRRAAIEERYTVQDIPVMLSELPSGIFYSESGNGIGYTYFTLRGFDQRRISVMINGIPQNDPLDHNVYWLNFSDLQSTLEKIQVQRGAGSAFYGPPSIGGSVNLVTSAFSNTREAEFSASTGSYNTRRYGVAVSSGLLDNTVSFHAKLARILSDGYRDNSWVDLTSYYLNATRFDENMTTQINLHGGINTDHLAYYGIPKADIGNRTKRRANYISRPEEIESFHQLHYNLLNEIRFGEALTLNNTLFLITSEGYFDYDGSWADTTYFRLTSEYGFSPTQNPQNALIRAWVGNRQWGWMPRVTLRTGGYEITSGFEFRFHNSLHNGAVRWASALPANMPTGHKYYQYRAMKNMASAYTQIYAPITNELRLMASLQGVYNQYRLREEQYVGHDFSTPYFFLNPRVGLTYTISDEWSTFLTVALTSREPRFNNLYDAGESSGGAVPQFEIDPLTGSYDFSKPLVKPERLVDLGYGLGYTTDGFRADMNLFYMDFSDEIVRKGGLDRFGQPRTGNADKTRHAGIELASSIALSEGLEVTGNISYSSNVIVRHITYERDPAGESLDANTIAGFPDLIANGRATYRTDGFSVSMLVKYVGRQYTDNFNDPLMTVDPYVTTDLTFRADLSRLTRFPLPELRLDIFNLFDALYASHGEGANFFPAAERHFLFSMRYSI